MPLSMSMTSHIFRNVLQQVLKNTFVEGVLSTGRYVNAIRGSTGCALEPKLIFYSWSTGVARKALI